MDATDNVVGHMSGGLVDLAEVPVSEEATAGGDADVPAERATPHRIAIVGFTPTRVDAWPLLEQDDWSVWGMNNLHLQPGVPPAKLFDQWFDLHPTKLVIRDEAHLRWLEGGSDGVDTWVMELPPADMKPWPMATEFPREQMKAKFGRYFTNSVSWMTAFAISQIMAGCEDGRPPEGAALAIYGIDMATGTEYASQRPSCEYFLGIAAGLGIQIVLPERSDLLKSAVLYGEDDGAFRAKLDERFEQLRSQLSDHENQARQHSDAAHQMRGALETLAYVREVWTPPNVQRPSEDGAAPAT